MSYKTNTMVRRDVDALVHALHLELMKEALIKVSKRSFRCLIYNYVLHNLCLDSQENLFGYEIAKLYHQIGENQIAKQYIVSYLSGKEDCAPGHFLAGQIAEALGENEAAVTSFERSYSIDRSQQHLVSLTCSLSKRDRQQCWSKRAETLSTQGIATN